MRIYEHVPQETGEVLSFRNAIFGYVSQEHWKAMNCTAVVAREDDQLLGFIPLQFREQCLSAHVTVPVVYENAVGVAGGMRGQGVGTQMLDEAARFISDRMDVMGEHVRMSSGGASGAKDTGFIARLDMGMCRTVGITP